MNITLSVPLRSSMDRLLQAITTQAGIAGWFTPDVHAEPKVGSVLDVGFGPQFKLAYRIEAIDPAGRVEWIATAGGEEWGWKGTRHIFEAKAQGDMLQFAFTHANLPENYPMQGFLTYCWANHMRSLKLLLETGAGEPFGSAASRAWHPLG